MAEPTAPVAPTWNNTIKDYFTQLEIGAMRTHGPRFDLGDYNQVKKYTLNDNGSVNTTMSGIYGQVKSGNMPSGGPKWNDTRVATYLAWAQAGCPED